MLRILIFGAAGSGATTVAKKISDILEISHFDSDEYYWIKTDPPYRVKQPLIERQKNLKADLEKERNWVVSGSLHAWGAFISELLTHAVFLYVPKALRMQRLADREQTRYGHRIREGGDMFEHHRAFMEWAASYDDETSTSSRTKLKHLNWKDSLPCPVFEIQNDEAVDVIVRKILKECLSSQNI
ncbi:MAG: AAA family ATPase [Gammaproteobacteria bacterium]